MDLEKTMQELPQLGGDVSKMFVVGYNPATGESIRYNMSDFTKDGYLFGGVIEPTTKITAPKNKVIYMATTPGTYTQCGGLVVADGEKCLLVWNGSKWRKGVLDLGDKVDIAQEFGDSTTKVMSQKSLSDEFTFSTSPKSEFVKECLLIGGDKSKHYRIGGLGRKYNENRSYIYILEVESKQIVAYLQSTLIDENKDIVLRLPEENNSGITAYMVVDWSIFPIGYNSGTDIVFNDNVYKVEKNPTIYGYINLREEILRIRKEVGFTQVATTITAYKDVPLKQPITKGAKIQSILFGGEEITIFGRNTYNASVKQDLKAGTIVEFDIYFIRASNVGDITIITESEIEIGDGAVTTPKVADKAITREKLADDVIPKGKEFVDTNAPYSNNIAELFIYPKYNEERFGKLETKIYTDEFYVKPPYGIIQSGQYEWNSYTKIPNNQDYHNEVLPITVYLTNDENVKRGDIIGYVVFKDTKGLLELQNTNNFKVLEPSYNVTNCPIIYEYLRRKEEETEKAGDVSVNLPNEIPIVVGDTLQLMYRSCIRCFNPYIYPIKTIADIIAFNYPRYFSYTPNESAVGKSYEVNINVLDNNSNVLAQGASKIKVIAKMTSPTTKKNVLCFGASATASGAWANELKRRLTALDGDGTPLNPKGLGLTNIEFVGRKEGGSFPVKLEATGGWRWSHYAGQGVYAVRFFFDKSINPSFAVFDKYKFKYNQKQKDGTFVLKECVGIIQEKNISEGADGNNIRVIAADGYNFPNENDTIIASGQLIKEKGEGDNSVNYINAQFEAYNPFWNTATKKLDFKNYSKLYCNNVDIDVMIAHCGVNDTFGITQESQTISLFENSIKPLIRAYHTDYPNGKFIISTLPLPDCTGGMTANYYASDSTYYRVAQSFIWFAKHANLLVLEDEFKDYVKVANVMQQFDCENLYPKKSANVCNRCETKEQLGTNGVHPTSLGSFCVADAIYATFNDLGL